MQKKLYRSSLIIIGALLLPIVPFAIIGELPGEQWLSARDDSALIFALSGCAVLLLDIVLPLPSSIVGTLIAARLGFWAGFATIWVGLTAGHCLGYLLARLALKRINVELSEVPTLLIVFLSRPVPILAEATALTAGAGGIPFFHFFAACTAGNVIYAGVLAANGAALLPDSLFGPGLFIPMLLPVLGWLVWQWASKRRSVSESSTQP